MDVDVLIDKLSLVAENILEEAANQPLAYVEASRYRVDKMRVRAHAAANLEYLRARVGMLLRQRFRANGEKVTEWAVKERVTCNKKVRIAIRTLDNAEAEEEFAKLLLDAYKQRRDAVRIIGESQLAEGTRGTRELEYIQQKDKMRKVAREVQSARQRLTED